MKFAILTLALISAASAVVAQTAPVVEPVPVPVNPVLVLGPAASVYVPIIIVAAGAIAVGIQVSNSTN